MYLSCVCISYPHLSARLTYRILFATHLFSILARAKALEIQKKKDRDALKAKIAREKEEEKQRKIQEAKDKAAALEREKQEAKGMYSRNSDISFMCTLCISCHDLYVLIMCMYVFNHC